jgi:hypothetical protein
MAILPTVRRRSMRTSLAFSTGVLDVERVDGDDDLDDPSFSVLSRDADQLFLSATAGTGSSVRRSSSRPATSRQVVGDPARACRAPGWTAPRPRASFPSRDASPSLDPDAPSVYE